jgi:hypothetical protein
MTGDRLRICILSATLLCGACTINYYRDMRPPPAPPAPVQPTERPFVLPAPQCAVDWRAAAAPGRTLEELRHTILAIASSGPCGRTVLIVHPRGRDLDWANGVSDWDPARIVQTAIIEDGRDGDGLVRRLHVFTSQPSDGPLVSVVRPPPLTDQPPVAPPVVRIVPGQPPPCPECAQRPSPAVFPGARGSVSSVNKAIPPALIGGGLVYALIYLNLLSAPGVGTASLAARRPDRLRFGDEEDTPESAATAAAAEDWGVRVRAAAFEKGES